MKKTLRHWAVAAVGAAAALAFSSCAYDPYYSSAGGSYSSGYGEGYGYGGSNFSTSVFVGTGDPRWGYDPYCYSYYDYSRRCYYDPYLNGYYPIGYRPPVVYGVPHPYGYGHGYCPPPRYVNNVTVVNYRNRESAYRHSNYGWAKQVRQQPVTQGRVQDQHPSRYSPNQGSSRNSTYSNNYGRQEYGTRQSGGSYNRPTDNRSSYYQGTKPNTRTQQNAHLPSGYNTPANHSSRSQDNYRQPQQTRYGQPDPKPRNQAHQSSQPGMQGGNRGNNYRQSQPSAPRGGNQGRQEESRPAKENKKGVRSLGDA